MLIRHIEFSGIGPFAGRHSIDMDQLTAHNVFLIEGPTGAGKSSIIDVVVFALYGGVAGKESSDRRMRSSHASLTEESWVDLVFTVASGTYRVRRSPAQSIAKKRGNGTRELNQSASLWRLSEAAVDAQEWESGEPLATGARESSQIIRDIVGMSKEQFVQTVVLPQGQFADFLRLNSKDRSALLEKIFHTAGYRDVMEDVKSQAKDAQAQIHQAFTQYSSALDVWFNNDGIPSETLEELQQVRRQALSSSIPDTPENDRALLALIRTSCEALNAESEEASIQLSNAQEKEKIAHAALEEGRTLAQLIDKKSQLLARYQELSERKTDIDSLIEKLEQHNKADIPLMRHNDALQARNALHAAQKAANEENAEKTAVLKKIQNFDLSINETGELLGHIRSFLDQEKELTNKKKKYETLREQHQHLEERITVLTTDLEKFPQHIDALAHKRQELLTDAETEKEHTYELDTVTQLIDTAKKHAHAKQNLDEASSALQTALESQQQAKSDYDRLTAQWVASVAANLAQQLHENSECPVCGSISHPSPAQPTSTHTDRSHVDKAQKNLNEAHSALSKAQSAHSAAHSLLQSLTSQLKDHTLESLTIRSDELHAAIEQAHTAGEKASALEKEIETLTHQHTAAKEALAEKREEAARIASTIAEYTSTITTMEKTLEEARDGYASIIDRYTSLSSQREDLHQQRELYLGLSSALEDNEQAAKAAEEALTRSPFVSLEDAKHARITPESLAAFQEEIDTYHDSFSGVKAQLAEPDIAQLTGEENVDIEQLEHNHTAQKKACEQAQYKAALTSQYASSAQRALKNVIAASKRWHRTADSAQAVARLANIATAGDMSLSNIPLNIWVLLKRFEIVVARANEHLNTISGGRYELKRVDESSGNKKAGLDLRVIDREGSERGDEERDTASLSGGETFYTSLALALALAEVVQEEQGGMRIDTLLIDEGFGTLSDDVREAVMRTLTSLSAHGRVVGIVSHIEELKKLVPNRITVRRTPDGSSTLSVTA